MSWSCTQAPREWKTTYQQPSTNYSVYEGTKAFDFCPHFFGHWIIQESSMRSIGVRSKKISSDSVSSFFWVIPFKTFTTTTKAFEHTGFPRCGGSSEDWLSSPFTSKLKRLWQKQRTGRYNRWNHLSTLHILQIQKLMHRQHRRLANTAKTHFEQNKEVQKPPNIW